MNDKTLNAHIKRADALKRDIDRMKKQYDQEREKITQELESRDINIYTTADIIARVTKYTMSKFNTTKFKNAQPDIYKAFCDDQAVTRFTITRG